MTALVRYEAMRAAVQACARVDEALDLRDRAAALAAYARQRDDDELQVWTQEIRLRACLRIGELVRALERAQGVRPRPPDITVRMSKEAAIGAAGLNPRVGRRYEALAGPADPTLHAAGRAGAERYLAASRASRTPATQDGLRQAVATAVHAAMGPAAVRRAAQDLQRAAAAGKRDARDRKEESLADATVAASQRLGRRLYGLIYADPPWRLEPYSRDSGLNRAADNHYPTMPTDVIAALRVPAVDDCVLFLWATAPMLLDALAVMAGWGFGYRSHVVWAKDRLGLGYWVRSKHELLLIGVKGKVPAPSPGTQMPSVVEAPVGRHSAKPAVFAEAIERQFPTLPRLEMFCRTPRPGWDAWGNEVSATDRAA